TSERESEMQRLNIRIGELERQLAAARQTAEPSATDRRRVMLALLRDPETAMLSNREIARRTGLAPQTVCNWRNRLGLTFGGCQAPQRTVTRAGRIYSMNTRRIGKRARTASGGRPPPLPTLEAANRIC